MLEPRQPHMRAKILKLRSLYLVTCPIRSLSCCKSPACCGLIPISLKTRNQGGGSSLLFPDAGAKMKSAISTGRIPSRKRSHHNLGVLQLGSQACLFLQAFVQSIGC
jgi:hypothetical protein